LKSLGRQEFEEVYLNGKKFHSTFFTLIFLASQDIRFGFVVSKKHGSAVVRNKIRRRIKAALENILKHLSLDQTGHIVVVPKTGIAKAGFKDLCEDLYKVAKKALVVS